MIFKLVCIILAIFTISISKTIQKVQKKNIQIELGQQYLEIIPQKFKHFQHSSLASLKRNTIYNQRPICQIRSYKQGELKHLNTLHYTQQNISSQNRKIIYKLSELKNLKIFIDAITINKDRIISLYSNNQIVIYRIGQDGLLYNEKKFKILQNQHITDGKFVIIYNQPYFLSKDIMFRVNVSGQITITEGYIELSQMFDDFIFIDDHIYLAGGNDGLIHYVIDHTFNRLRGYGRMKFQLKGQEAYGLFDVDQIHIEKGQSNTNILYILDYNEGLIKTTISTWPQLQPNQNVTTIIINQSVALIGGCQNLIVTIFHIYLTCPELIQFNKFNHRVEKSNHLSFSPNRLEFDSKRIYAFGNKQFAVYDIYGSSLAEYTFDSVVEKSIMVGIYLLSFSNKQVTSVLIQPQKEALYCYTLDSAKAGTYQGSFITQGLCSEQKSQISTNDQICYVQYPFSLSIKLMKQPNYMIYLIILVAFFSFSGIVSLIALIRYNIMNKKYKRLVEEEQKNEGPSNLQLDQKNKKKQQQGVSSQ